METVSVNAGFDPCLSEMLDSSLMENTIDSLESGLISYNFPTPPHESEELCSPDMANESDSSSGASPVSDTVPGSEDDIFGELFAVNADTLGFDDVSEEHEQILGDSDEFLADFNLDGVDKEIDDIDLDSDLVSYITGTLTSAQPDNTKNDDDVSKSPSSVTSSPVGDNASVNICHVPPHILRPRALFGQQSQGDDDEQSSAIHMDKVSQYRQSAFKAIPSRTKGGKTVPAASAQPSHVARPRKNKFDLDAVDISKVPPSRKAAVQAKINREKKKAYIESLEREKFLLQQENGSLKQRSQRLEKERDELAEEAAYLRRVLFNDSHLAGMLSNIGNTPNIKLSVRNVPPVSTDSASRKRSCSSENIDHDYSSKSRKTSITGASASAVTAAGGVCLHVHQDNVTVEFCRHCANHNA